MYPIFANDAGPSEELKIDENLTYDDSTGIINCGGVTIGATTSLAPLTIADPGVNMQMWAQQTATNSCFSQWSNDQTVLRVGADGAGFTGAGPQANIGTWNVSDLVFSVNASEKVRISPSSAFPFTVAGDSRFNGRLVTGVEYDGGPYASCLQAVGVAGEGLISMIRNGNTVRVMGYLPNSNTWAICSWSVTGSGVTLADGGQSWGQTSDERVKTIHGELDGVLDKLKDVRCVRYNLHEDSESRPIGEGVKYAKQRLGFIAQDILPHWPEAVDTENPDRYQLTVTDMVPVSVAAIKELAAKMEAMEARIAQLEAQTSSSS